MFGVFDPCGINAIIRKRNRVHSGLVKRLRKNRLKRCRVVAAGICVHQDIAGSSICSFFCRAILQGNGD